MESWLDVAVREFGEQSGTWEGEDARRKFFEGAPWSREKLSLMEITKRWKDLTNSDGSLKPENMPQLAIDIGITGSVFLPPSLKEESVQEKLKTSGCLYIIYFSVQMNHAIVSYGFDTSDGVLVMDPNPERGLITRQVDFFKEPGRVQKMMFVGWAI